MFIYCYFRLFVYSFVFLLLCKFKFSSIYSFICLLVYLLVFYDCMCAWTYVCWLVYIQPSHTFYRILLLLSYSSIYSIFSSINFLKTAKFTRRHYLSPLVTFVYHTVYRTSSFTFLTSNHILSPLTTVSSYFTLLHYTTLYFSSSSFQSTHHYLYYDLLLTTSYHTFLLLYFTTLYFLSHSAILSINYFFLIIVIRSIGISY